MEDHFWVAVLNKAGSLGWEVVGRLLGGVTLIYAITKIKSELEIVLPS